MNAAQGQQPNPWIAVSGSSVWSSSRSTAGLCDGTESPFAPFDSFSVVSGADMTLIDEPGEQMSSHDRALRLK